MSIITLDGLQYWDVQAVMDYTASIGKPVKANTIHWYVSMERLTPAGYYGGRLLFTPETVRAFFTPDRRSGPKSRRKQKIER